MREPRSIAIIGAGLIGRRHAAIVQASDGVNVSAVVDPAPEASAFAATIGAAYHADWRAVTQTGPDGIIVATPNALHEAPTVAALEAGIPVLVEKPLADTVEAGARIVETAQLTGTPLLVGHHRRHAPFVEAAKTRIESGEIGRIVAAHAFFWIAKPDTYFQQPWRREAGAGPLFINLIHDVEMLLHLCGPIAAVTARTSNAVRGHPVEDTVSVMLRFESGALGTITASDAIVGPWSWELTSGENPAYPHTDQCALMIGGSKGSLALPTGTLWQQEIPDWWAPLETTRQTRPPADPLALQFAHFVDVIRGEATPRVSGEDALGALQVIDAIAQSGATGAEVTITTLVS